MGGLGVYLCPNCTIDKLAKTSANYQFKMQIAYFAEL